MEGRRHGELQLAGGNGGGRRVWAPGGALPLFIGDGGGWRRLRGVSALPGEGPFGRDGSTARRRPWVACRAEKGRGCVAAARGARRERFRAKPGACEVELAGGTSRARRVADAGGERRHGGKQRGERCSEGSLVNKAKFKIFFCKLNFSPLSWPQIKIF